jgi:hypothetical protein
MIQLFIFSFINNILGNTIHKLDLKELSFIIIKIII